MWNVIFVLSLFGMFVFPPLFILAVIALWKANRADEQKLIKESERTRLRAGFNNSHPGPCPVCGKEMWSRGPTRIVPSMGIRGFAFPLTGNAAVVSFTCVICGAYGRYARPYDAPELGWNLMDRYLGGW